MHLSTGDKLPKVLGEKILYELTPEKRDEILRQLTPHHIHPDDVDELKEASYRFRRKKQETSDHLQQQSEERREKTRQHWKESSGL
jgi:hypothetical protein